MDYIMILSRVTQRTNVVLLLVILMEHKSVDSIIVHAPSDTTAIVNESTYFNCSTSIRPINEQSIIWFHFPLDGGGQRKYVYDDGRIMTNYKNRFDIEIDLSTGTFSLLALRLETRDAGRYECRDDIQEDIGASAELTVLASNLVCESDMNPGSVVGPTQCEEFIAPAEVPLSCSVTYRGGKAPQMTWRKFGDSLNSTITDCVTRNNRVTCNSTLTANLNLNGSLYTCELKTQQYNCSLQISNMLYVFSGNSRVNTIVDREVKCSANSSQSCSYKWKWLNGSDSLTVSTDQTLKPTRVGSHRCEATCPIGNTSCTVDVMFAEVYSTQTHEATAGHNLWWLSLLLLVGTIFIAVLVWRRESATEIFSAVVVVQVLAETDENLQKMDLDTIVYQICEILQGDKSTALQEAVSTLIIFGLIDVSRVKKSIVFFFHCSNMEKLFSLRDLLITKVKRNIDSIYNEVLSTHVNIKVTLDDSAFKKAEKRLQDGRRRREPSSSTTEGVQLMRDYKKTDYPQVEDGEIERIFDTAPYIIKGLSSGEIRGPMQFKDRKCTCERITLTRNEQTTANGRLMTKEDIVCRKGSEWMALDNGNLIKFYHIVIQSQALFIVMEYAAGGSVREALKKWPPHEVNLPMPVVKNWARQIAKGMEYLHVHNIVHKNLNSVRILIMEAVEALRDKTLKISQFCLTDDEFRTHIQERFSYVAPEVLDGVYYKESDVWSFGIIVWEILTKRIPFEEVKSVDKICTHIGQGAKVLKIPNSCPKALQTTLRGCRSLVPSERPSFREILASLQEWQLVDSSV